MSYIKMNNIVKKYQGAYREVLHNFDLSIAKGEFIVIVGPSGSGKSTLLEIICGFEAPTSGTIEIDGTVVNEVLPKNRNVSMVFQDYALFPHMTVCENIAFGMKIRKVDKSTIDKKVRWAAEILQLDKYLKVKPSKLSGGQRQRVALARAMVREPKLFLMDEPLSSLDSKLRYETCHEILNLHNKINATTIYVTHDQVEALSLADRIVVLNDGVIQQNDVPIEVYENPANLFVAKFIGRPQMNLFEVVVNKDNITLDEFLKFRRDLIKLPEYNNRYILGIRSEHIICLDKECKDSIEAIIEKTEYTGGETLLYLKANRISFTMKYTKNKRLKIGDTIHVTFDFKKASIFDYKTKVNIKERQYEENY
ncbi:ABC transporter ATP-binding protein [Romboutsia weinsteinii]|uniref:ABC transporter ATP-binding protein n=2 Tax=Romboutsia weinsteinii TaxID=2020949 RepID=A0A371IXB8_9FIRM|nr:ABC transporter ATP-binding protein [Romboutsia weinsteinii]